MKNRFSALAFLTAQPLLQSLFLHPFVLELIDGILSRERFLYYIEQDCLYLTAYSRALALTAGKMRALDDTDRALRFASLALAAVGELHKRYFKEYGLPRSKSPAPACFAYRSHLLERAALAAPAESMAALLPRFFMYREVCNHVRSLADTDNPWFAWIESFSSDAFSRLADEAAQITDALASETSDEDRQGLMESYIASCRYECALWEDAYTLRQWPS